MGIKPRPKNCFVETHKAELQIKQLCDGLTEDYFLDETENHNKTLITVTNTSETYCEMELIVNEKSYPRIPSGRSFAVQQEDVRSVSIRCHERPPITVTVTTSPTVTVTQTKPITVTQTEFPTVTVTQPPVTVTQTEFPTVTITQTQEAILEQVADYCTGTLTIQKTFCICCDE